MPLSMETVSVAGTALAGTGSATWSRPPRTAPVAPEALVAGGRGLLVLDDDHRPLARRLRRHGISGSPAMRETLRDLVIRAPGLPHHVAALQLPREVVRSIGTAGLPEGILLGARVDSGAQPMPGRTGESLTLGLGDLPERLDDLVVAGASFACWRTVFVIKDGPDREPAPSAAVIQANTQLMALFAASCVRAGLVPVLVVDVRNDGHHSAWDSAAAAACVFDGLFGALRANRVSASQVVLATGMAVEGRGSGTQADPETVAEATARAVAGIPSHLGALGYLCDGERFPRAVENLGRSRSSGTPWPSGFVVGRAASEVVMATWHGEAPEADRAQGVLLERLCRLHEAGAQRAPQPETCIAARAGASAWRQE